MKRKQNLHRFYLKKGFLIAFFLITIFLIGADFMMRPLIKSAVESKASILCTNAINEVVSSELSKLALNYTDIIKIEKDSEGKIMAIGTNMQTVNELKAILGIKIHEKISSMQSSVIKIPIGNLTGTEIFNGFGPAIPLEISMSGHLNTDFKSELKEAGINQTRHQILLTIVADVFAMIPGYPVKTVVNTSMIISETVIIGEVPSFFCTT